MHVVRVVACDCRWPVSRFIVLSCVLSIHYSFAVTVFSLSKISILALETFCLMKYELLLILTADG